MPSRRAFLAAGSALFAAGLAGCSNPLSDEQPSGTDWTASVPEPASLSPPVVTNGWLAVGGNRGKGIESGHLAVLDAATGARQWDVDLGEMTGLTAANGRVYVGELGGPREAVAQIYAFDATSGDRLWTQTVTNRASALTVADGTLYAANGSLAALRTDDGTRLWERSSVAGTEFSVVAAPDDQLAADDAAVYFGDDRGVVALAPDDGSRNWTWRPDGWPSTTVGPFPADGRLYVGADGVVVALDRATGDRLWRTSFGADSRVQGLHSTGSSLLVAEATEQAPSGGFGTVYELSLGGGERYEYRFDEPVMGTASTQDRFVVGTNTGQVTWFEGISFFTPPATTLPGDGFLLGAGDEQVFAQTADGTLYALSRP